MKSLPLVATEATKDLWAAFIRTMGVPLAQREAAARSEASRLVSNWLSINEAEARTWYNNENRKSGRSPAASLPPILPATCDSKYLKPRCPPG